MHSVSIVGCGYTGLRLARRWLDSGARVRGYATRPESLRQIAAAGVDALALDLDQAVADERLADIVRDDDLVFYCAPPAPTGQTDTRLTRLLEGIVTRPRRFVYLSTTGVYGDHQGGHVDEDTPPTPRTARAARRLAAETDLRTWAQARQLSWCILRVAGIYGPGRLPLTRLASREPAIDPREAMPTNRIHVDDLVGAALAAGVAESADRRIFNVTDGSDESSTAFLQRVARMARLPEPPLISRREAEQTFSASTWSFLGESRRVDNRRLREELGLRLAYADLDAGILASL
jgi:nucleoside-diphosphate-sugar epimerase